MERTGRIATPRAQRTRRGRGARIIIIAVMAFLATALIRLQVLHGEQYARVARENRMRPLPIPAPRGTIYDRHGQVIAENVPGYQIQLMPGSPDTMDAQIARLRPILGLTDGDITRAKRKWQRQSHLPMVLMADAPPLSVARLEERRYQFPGVLVHEYAKRRYSAGDAVAHIIGYVSEISEEELKRPEFAGYEQGRWIGKSGLERQYEAHLGGTPGMRFLEVDAWGRIKRWLPEEMGKPPVPGRDLQLHLDLDLQRYIAGIFPRGYNGAFVALDPQTGGVLALYSHPSYDPNLFIGGISTENYRRLADDPNKPLLDRAAGSRQPPASTWKLQMAALALELGVITPEEVMPIACTGGMYFGRYARCHAVHGPQSLVPGIYNSCDVYFYQVGIRIGLRRFMEVGTRLGFGARTGIDLPTEIANTFPASVDWFREHYGYAPNENEIMTMSIGQGAVVMTPLKMAEMYAMVARPDGVALEPRLAVTGEPPKVAFDLKVSEENLEYLRKGMRRVVGPQGTARLSRLQHWDFMGKTGTAQACAIGRGCTLRDHAWFIGSGGPPGKHPEIVASMFIEHGEHGYFPSGFVANAINFYLNRKYGRPFEPYPTPRERFPRGLPTGDWWLLPVQDPVMTDTHTYPVIRGADETADTTQAEGAATR
ncbi:MAG TPA: penicillin-binding protein 2 [Longimicrobiales bacterium]|nr:penicillin-binding protein 2 [Longimicrobiales bacterium]